MENEAIKKLATKLESKTKLGKLSWSPSGKNCYRIALGSGLVVIEYNATPVLPSFSGSLDTYVLTVFNDRNEQIGQYGSSNSSNPDYSLLKSIFTNAKRCYLKIDSTYRSMLDALDL